MVLLAKVYPFIKDSYANGICQITLFFFKFPFCIKVESPKKGSPSKSLYAKATDTGVDPQAAKRLNIDWDSAVDIDPEEEDVDNIDVPPVVVNILDHSLSCIHRSINHSCL